MWIFNKIIQASEHRGSVFDNRKLQNQRTKGTTYVPKLGTYYWGANILKEDGPNGKFIQGPNKVKQAISNAGYTIGNNGITPTKKIYFYTNPYNITAWDGKSNTWRGFGKRQKASDGNYYFIGGTEKKPLFFTGEVNDKNQMVHKTGLTLASKSKTDETDKTGKVGTTSSVTVGTNPNFFTRAYEQQARAAGFSNQEDVRAFQKWAGQRGYLAGEGNGTGNDWDGIYGKLTDTAYKDHIDEWNKYKAAKNNLISAQHTVDFTPQFIQDQGQATKNWETFRNSNQNNPLSDYSGINQSFSDIYLQNKRNSDKDTARKSVQAWLKDNTKNFFDNKGNLTTGWTNFAKTLSGDAGRYFRRHLLNNQNFINEMRSNWATQNGWKQDESGNLVKDASGNLVKNQVENQAYKDAVARRDQLQNTMNSGIKYGASRFANTNVGRSMINNLHIPSAEEQSILLKSTETTPTSIQTQENTTSLNFGSQGAVDAMRDTSNELSPIAQATFDQYTKNNPLKKAIIQKQGGKLWLAKFKMFKKGGIIKDQKPAGPLEFTKGFGNTQFAKNINTDKQKAKNILSGIVKTGVQSVNNELQAKENYNNRLRAKFGSYYDPEKVKKLQKKLVKYGFLKATKKGENLIDGDYGPKTKQAEEAYNK